MAKGTDSEQGCSGATLCDSRLWTNYAVLLCCVLNSPTTFFKKEKQPLSPKVVSTEYP